MDVGGIADVKDLYAGAGAKYITLVDPQNAMGDAWGFKVVPNGWLIDESGTIIKKWLGGFDVNRSNIIKDVDDFLDRPPVKAGERSKPVDDKTRIANLKKQLKANASNGQANLELGKILLRQDRAKEAMPYLGKAVKLLPKNASAMFALGSCTLAQGEKKAALAIIKNALKLDPTNYLIRKQIWHLEYPEKFHPTIDWGWQREQMARERAAERGGG